MSYPKLSVALSLMMQEFFNVTFFSNNKFKIIFLFSFFKHICGFKKDPIILLRIIWEAILNCYYLTYCFRDNM